MGDFLVNLPYRILASAFLGAAFLWLKLRYGTDIYKSLQQLIAEAGDLDGKTIMHLIVFCMIGSVVTVMLIEPNTIKQALVAGAGFTVFLGDLYKPAASQKRTVK